MSEYYKRTPLNSKITLEQAIHDKGYYDTYHNWNSILTLNEYPGKLFRGRVEVLVLDANNDVFLSLLSDDHYRIPGGSFDRGKSHTYQAITEVREEARIIVKHIIYTGVTYTKFFKKKYTNCNMHWDGSFNKVYVARFKKWYWGRVNKSVRDMNMYKYGQFIPLDFAKEFLIPEHKEAIDRYLNYKKR